jgi:predicted Zn-dependent peptidase
MKLKHAVLGMALTTLLFSGPALQAAPAEPFTKVVLKNNLTLMYKVMKGQPMVSISAVLPIGMNREKEKGIAHLLEHLVFRGGSGYTFRDIAAVTNRQGGNFNGYTSFYATAYIYQVPKESFEQGLKVFNGSLWGTELSLPIVALEQRIVLHELDMDYSERYAYYPLFKYFFAEILYSKETIAAITPEDLKTFHKTFYQPEKATFIIAGDFDPAQVIAELEKVQNAYGRIAAPPSAASFALNLPKQAIVENRNLYPYQFQLMLAYEFSDMIPQDRMILKLLAYMYGYGAKIDYLRNEYKVYYTLARSIGAKDYFAIYYLERNASYSDAVLQQEKANMLKFFREFRKAEFTKELRNFIKLIEQEQKLSQISPEAAVDYELQRLTNPEDRNTVDSLAVLKKLTQKDLERVLDNYFNKPPTTWILVKTTK